MTSHPPTSDRYEHARGGKGRAIAASTLVGALALGAFGLALPAQAAVSADAAVVINEVYGGGGNGSAVLNRDFVELKNTSDATVDLASWSVQYAGPTGSSWQVTPLTGQTLEPGEHLLVGEAFGTNTQFPGFDADVEGTIAMGAERGKVALVSTSTAIAGDAGVATLPEVVDFIGWGSATDFAGAAAPASSVTQSVARDSSGANTANNAADFTAGAPTPTNSDTGENPDPEPTQTTSPSPSPSPSETTAPVEPTVVPIDEIQGTTDTSPLAGQTITTEGVVTAKYPSGGLNGVVIQTSGTGGALDLTSHTASDAVFVYAPSAVAGLNIDDTVRVTGTVSERFGQTQVSTAVAGGSIAVIAAQPAPAPATVMWPTADAQRESLEQMLVLPQGEYTVSDTYDTNTFGEVGLATGTTPLRQRTDVARPGTTEAAGVAADNYARGVLLDDGRTFSYATVANSTLTPPYISLTEPLVVGGSATFNGPVIVGYDRDLWRFQPTEPVVGDGTGADFITFSNPRTPAPEPVGGDVSVASFNVLNYFTTLGTDDIDDCESYDPALNGQENSVREGCDQRGAWDAEDFARQETKIVAAIEDLDASVVGLMEIENSAALGEAADEAVASLVDALNDAAGSDKWSFVRSSADLPDASTRDVITNAIIYQNALVKTQGESLALGDQSDTDEAFQNAREPIGQVFAPVDGGEPFLFVVNHFKSKGSAGPWPGDADTGDGQGSSNESRVRQATALAAWVEGLQGSTESVILAGDFNSYGQEDPLQVLYTAGYEDAETSFDLGESSYSYGGMVGSLDHVLLNEAARERATGADIWNINSGESIALEYSRYRYSGTDFYEDGPYRSSDHDPVKVGLLAEAPPVELTLLGINDFHGRIDGNTVEFAGTIEQLREAASGETLFLSSGDNIGASVFASSLAKDQPTIDVLNALGLETTAVGNHEFDQGFDDLTERVIPESDYSHLGANVYTAGTQTPVLDEYDTIEVDGLTVGIVGVVTEETPSLVAAAGIAGLEFGDPVEAMNRVAAQLSDGVETNGEADVIIAMYHEGAPLTTTPTATPTLEEQLAESAVFDEIVNETSAEVDAIFTGHTHARYAYAAPVPGTEGTRPVLQTGSYGEFIGKIVLTIDPATGDLLAHTQENVARTTATEESLIAAYPRVAEVSEIVSAALAEAQAVGNKKVAEITDDITTAFSGGSYIDGVWTGGTRDNRAAESALGKLVANGLRDSLSSLPNGAQIGVTNPGGLRSDLFYSQADYASPIPGLQDGDVSFSQANAVQTFLNNLALITLTGEQFVEALEQQWQRNPDGTVPSRPYLQLGLSDNVTYTYDETRPEGSRITSVTVDGEPLDMAAEYRLGMPTFLASGSGDNFFAFGDGTDYVDTGLLDIDAWVDYLQEQSPVAPAFDKQAVSVVGAPETAAAGSEVAFTVSNLNLTSRGAPETTEITAMLGDTDLGSFPVIGGAAQITVTIPEDSTAGDVALILTTDAAGTTVTLPLTITADGTPGTENPGTGPSGTGEEAPNGSWATVTLNDRVEQGGRLTVTVSDLEPGQQIGATLFSDPIVVTGIPAADASGRTSFVIAIPADFALGAHQLVVTTEGEDPITVGVTVLANGQLAVTGSELPLGIAFAAGFLLVAGGLAFALRRRSPVTR